MSRPTGTAAGATVALAFVLALSGWGAAGANSLNYTYYCVDADQTGYFLRLGEGDLLEVQQNQTPQVYTGSYSYASGAVALSVPAIGFNERSVRTAVDRGFLIAFDTPSIQCNLIGHLNGPAVQGYARCPSIKHIPGVSYEDNAFEFYPERGVKRRRWRELTAANDTLYKEMFGIYVIDGDQLYMAFGWNQEEAILTGTIYPDYSFTINELEPGRGRCMPQ